MARTCTRCRTVSKPRQRKCGACGKALPKKRPPAHMKALGLPLEAYIEANGGYEGCWVCRELGIPPMGGPLQRDHEHKGDGKPRGLLCIYHNRKLGPAYTLELVRAYHAYLERNAA